MHQETATASNTAKHRYSEFTSDSTQDIKNVKVKSNSQAVVGTVEGSVYFGSSENLNDVLESLPTAEDAPFSAYHRQHDPTCLPDTRVDLLRQIYDWADGEDSPSIFWLSGLAGTGKSTVARTVSAEYSKKGALGASFFFSRGGGNVSHAGKFVTSIAVQLAQIVPDLEGIMRKNVVKHRDIASRSLREQWRHLIQGSLSELAGSSSSSLPRYVLVVDALDECEDENNIRTILQLLAEARSLVKVQLRVFLTSRPEIPIRNGFIRMPDAEYQDFILHKISSSVVDHDIDIFLRHELGFIAGEHNLGDGWPGEQMVEQLVQRAYGLFIWAATACRFINEGGMFAKDRLSIILKADSADDSTDGFSSDSSATGDTNDDRTVSPEQHLDRLYIKVLRDSVYKYKEKAERKKRRKLLATTMGAIVVLLSPLSTQSLEKVLNTPQNKIAQALNDLHAIFDIPKDPSHPLSLHHPSFRDFLLDKDRCGDSGFWVDEKQAHRDLASKCIQLMSGSLKQGVCGLNQPGALVADVEAGRVEQHLPSEVQYACLYWIQHLQRSQAQLCDDDQVHRFLQEHLLHWLEALGWIKKVSEGIHAIVLLESITPSHQCPELSKFVHDVKRFVLYSRSAIQQAPLQTYCSALVFAPEASIVKKQFRECASRWVRRLPRMDQEWNALLQVLEGHSDSVSGVAFSQDGKMLASASNDRTVKVWEARSGALLQTLEGHSDYVNSVVFSQDGKMLASASDDKTVKVWDAGSGALRQTLKGHSGWINSVAFSQDGKMLASASDDRTVKVWEARSGALPQTLKGHSDSVNSVAFSQDGKMLASASDDKTVKVWEARSWALSQTLKEHSDFVNGVAFSQDGKMLASASDDKTVKVWDAGSGALRQTLKGHSYPVSGVAFSQDSKMLASASKDKTVKVWEAGSGALLQTLEGHSDYVNGVAFSQDGKMLASVSSDKTVKVWKARSGALPQTLEGHSGWINSVAFSQDGKMLASASNDKTVKVWESGSGALLQTLEGHSQWVSGVAFSQDGKMLASASNDKTVKVWEARSGALLQTLEGHSDYVNSVVFSQDGKMLASASDDKTVKVWDAGSGALRQTLKGHSRPVNDVAFSQDGKMLASASDDKTVKVWESGSGALLQTLKGHSDSVRGVAFSQDGKMLASASYDTTVKVWNAGSRALRQTLYVGVLIHTLSFSGDGSFILTDRGSWPISSSFSSSIGSPQPRPPLSISVEDHWVSHYTERILWLPSEHRPSRIAIYGNTVGFGHPSGRVTVIQFAF